MLRYQFGICLLPLWMCWLALGLAAVPVASAFVPSFSIHKRYKFPRSARRVARLSMSTSDPPSSSSSGYVPPAPEQSPAEREWILYAKVGDIVRYYDLDGGRADGEVLVGKISFLQKTSAKDGTTKWLVELTELENVGDGYYAEYPSRKRRSKKTTRPLEEISPIAASFVRTESAYKVPRNVGSELPMVLAEQYTIEGFMGPFGDSEEIDVEVIQQDAELYGKLKSNLLRNAAIAGVVGTLIADLIKGTEDAVIYAAGAVAGVGYLFFLSLKTDTVASQEAKLGSNISNLRFVLPLMVMAGVAVYNLSLGDASPVTNPGFLSSVTPEQFAAAIFGFLTYRIPLFISQLSPLIRESAGSILPGSAGVALQALTSSSDDVAVDAVEEGLLTPVLVVSGPAGTAKTALVKRLIADGGQFVEPQRVDRVQDGATFERLLQRDEFLEVDPTGRYGLTKEGILNAADEDSESVVVVDADVELAKKLTKVSGARLIGVWIGLDSMDKFESGIEALVESGDIPIPPDETRETVVRAKLREIVQDIEYAVVSGIFEFTILNDDFDNSLEELKSASEYCFR